MRLKNKLLINELQRKKNKQIDLLLNFIKQEVSEYEIMLWGNIVATSRPQCV